MCSQKIIHIDTLVNMQSTSGVRKFHLPGVVAAAKKLKPDEGDKDDCIILDPKLSSVAAPSNKMRVSTKLRISCSGPESFQGAPWC